MMRRNHIDIPTSVSGVHAILARLPLLPLHKMTIDCFRKTSKAANEAAVSSGSGGAGRPKLQVRRVAATFAYHSLLDLLMRCVSDPVLVRRLALNFAASIDGQYPEIFH